MNRIITISREFGSGGRTTGKEIANRLGIHCYDAELLIINFYTDMKWGCTELYSNNKQKSTTTAVAKTTKRTKKRIFRLHK